MKTLRFSILAAILATSACGGGGGDTVPGDDAGGGDTTAETQPADTATEDTNVEDTNVEDTNVEDTSTTDTTTTDTAITDTAATETTAETSSETSVDAPPDTVVVTDTATTDATDAGPTLAWGAACNKGSTCDAPSGESGFCALTYGKPLCLRTCNAQKDYTLCEGGAGICVPSDDGKKYCVKKCGDATSTTCGDGASCAFLGYRAAADASFVEVGACVPDCTATGKDACTGTGTVCDTARRRCGDIGCGGSCPTGSSCSGSACVPTTPIALYGACQQQPSGVANGCMSGLCFALPSPELGFCGTFCNSESGDTTCGAGGVCWFDNSAITAAEASDSGVISYPNGSFSVVGGRSAGACIKKCNDTADCPKGFFCGTTNGVRACVPGALERPSTSTGTGIAGAVCRNNTDCASGTCAKATGYADGICTRASAAVPCPSGTVADTGNPNICWPTCTGTGTAECRASLVCSASAKRCMIGICRDNADCASGYTCDKESSSCVVSPKTTGSAIGEACTSDPSCKSNFCATGTDWPSGYCTASCTVLPELTDTCPNGAICTADRIGKLGNCLDLCDSTGTPAKFGSCRTGYKCTPFTGDPRYGYCAKS